MVNSHESFQSGEQPTTTKVFVDSDRVRIETEGEFGRSVMIFRGDKQTMWIVAPDRRSYQELTKEQVDRFGEQMGGRMAEMRQQMQEQLKNMPPERRKMVEQMMKSRMGGMLMAAAPTSKTEYSLVASGQQVNQWTCDKYEGVRDGEKQRENLDGTAGRGRLRGFRLPGHEADVGIHQRFVAIRGRPGGTANAVSSGSRRGGSGFLRRARTADRLPRRPPKALAVNLRKCVAKISMRSYSKCRPVSRSSRCSAARATTRFSVRQPYVCLYAPRNSGRMCRS